MKEQNYKMSGLRVTSVPHCTEVGLVSVTDEKYPIGQPIGWCLDSELGVRSRGNEKYIGLRIYHSNYGECWGHALKKHLPIIFEA